MTSIHRIVHATDLSDTSAGALNYALSLTDYHQAELHLLHVTPVIHPFHFPHELAGGTWDLERAYAARAEEALRKLVPTDRPDVKAALVSGRKAATAISEYASSVGADLIVVGSHGYSGFDRLLIGSQAKNLVKIASVPVLIVAPEAGHAPGKDKPFSKLLAPVDLSAQSRTAITRAAQLAAEYGAELTVLHAIDLIVPSYYPVASPATQVPLAKQALGRFLDEAGLPVKPREVVVAAPAGPSIVAEAETSQCDLIVMSRSGLGRIQRFLIGSVTERVLNHAPCSVLILPGE